MGYAARQNPTARHFATPDGLADRRRQRAEVEAARARAAAAEFDRLVAAVHAPDALQRFGVGRLNAARAFLAQRGRRTVAHG
jgi:hypothetical protein